MIRILIRVDLINRHANGVINRTRYFCSRRTELTGMKRFRLKGVYAEVNTQGCLVMLVQRFVNLRCISTYLQRYSYRFSRTCLENTPTLEGRKHMVINRHSV